MSASVAMQPGRRFAERYRLERPGRSGTWVARDEVLARSVSLSFATLADEAGLAQFRSDALALARLSHPSIVATYDTGVEEDGTVFRVDELMDAVPLSSMRNAGTLAARRVIAAISQVARAVEFAHASGLAHGKLSGDDVLVCDDDRVKVTGFGISGPAHEASADLPALLRLFTELAAAAGGAPAALANDWRDRGAPASAGAVRQALLGLDPGPDDAVPMGSPHPTPPAGVAMRRRRGWVPLTALTLLAAAGLAIAASLIGSDNAPFVSKAKYGPLVGIANSFDPQGRPPVENEEAASRAVDGDRATSWSTERYRSRPFSGLKDGVGLVLRVDAAVEFLSLTVDSASEDWAAEVYVADRPSATLAGWGKPLAKRSELRGEVKFDLASARGTTVLFWITDPGTERRLVVREARLEGRR